MFQFVRDLFAAPAQSSAPDLKVRLSVGGMEERATPASLPPGGAFPQAVIHEPMIHSHPTQLDIHASGDIFLSPANRVAIVSHY